MKRLILTLFFISIFSSLLIAQVTIGWHQSPIEVDAGVAGQQIFVVLKNSYSAQGVWSFQFDITSTSITLNTGNVDLYTNLSTNFLYSESNITNGVRVIVYGRTNSRMFQPGFNSSVIVVTLPTLSAGSYSVTLSNASAIIRNYPGGSSPAIVTPTLSPATINITASTFVPPTSSPTFTPTGYPSTVSRKYGDIDWDNNVNIVDITSLADVLVGNYTNVIVNDATYNFDPPSGPNNRYFYQSSASESPIQYDNQNPDNADRTAADVHGGDGTLNLMDLATLEDAVVSGVWPSYAISAVAGRPVFKFNDKGFGNGAVIAKFGEGIQKLNADAKLKFEFFNPGGKASKIRVKLENSEALLKGLQIELTSSVLPGKLDIWKMPDAGKLAVAWKRNEFNKIVIVVYAVGGEYIKTGESVLLTIVAPNVTVEQFLNAEPNIIASVNNFGSDLNYNAYSIDEVLPLDYMLYQNYPNPFNPGTEIKFDIPEYSAVKIIVWNVLGQKVKTLIDANLDPGRKTVKWDGRDDNGNFVGSGVYFYTMYARSLDSDREFTMTRKAILIK
ncbi:MAG: hypothetical protein N2252_08845 [Candidatus Kryptonium sp.]|nr:hypothetical protein [Candidatus Kryptonium sp.]